MDPKSAKNGNNEEVCLTTKLLNSEQNVFYGVHIPPEVQTQEINIYSNVFEDKVEALQMVKKFKKARFKAFLYYHEAAEFAEHGSENSNNNTGTSNDHCVKSETIQGVGEKPSQFRGPTSQNLVKLRKNIESGDLEFVEKTIWDNPRYLIGSGDTPSILQEGFRYNGLHVAAKTKNHEMCELILNTISNIKFIKKMYVDDINPEQRAKILLDLYLNTPDKGLHETPLHFAVKFGAAKCVEVLVSFPQCDKNLRNKHGNLPTEIICDRYDGPDASTLRETISALLTDNYYVPVLRSEDNCTLPVIGEPFSPTSPPKFNSDPMSPRLEIHAYAGPMNREGAVRFRKMWKTPPRNRATPLKRDAVASLRFKDPEKGLERLGNNLAKQQNVGWKEYWPFLDCFIDIASNEGLDLLEEHLGDRATAVYKNDSTFDSSTQNNIKSNKSLPLNNSPKLPTEISPMTSLCRAFQACSLRDNSKLDAGDTIQNDVTNPLLCVERSLQVFAKRISNDILNLVEARHESCGTIEAQFKLLQMVVTSYRDDVRFATVDFHLIHNRLLQLIKANLKHSSADLEASRYLLEQWLESCQRKYDCVSSDEENGPDAWAYSKSRHTLCVLRSLIEDINGDEVVKDISNEEDCMAAWEDLKVCSCAWKEKLNKIRRVSSSCSRDNSSFRSNLTRKLSFREEEDEDDDEDNRDKSKSSKNTSLLNGNCSDEQLEEEFYTPPSTPKYPEDITDDEDDVFDETQLPDVEIFIEGDVPTKVDCAVYNALRYADCKLNPKDYPHIYKWHHACSLYQDEDRSSWSTPNLVKCKLGSPTVTSSTPVKQQQRGSELCFSYASPKQWLRVTGINSPRASLQNQKFNTSIDL